MNGLGLLRRLIELDPDPPVILTTGHGDIPMAVEAMREGAYDFFEKPYPPDRLIDSVRRATEKRRLVLENRTLRAELAHHQADDPLLLLGRSPAMEKLRQTLAGLAEIDVDFLMVGETGSGKEAAAMAVHRWSRREGGRFVALNCSALPEAAAEGELCGHEGGASAGGARRRVGRVEQADRGTLFLAEVESLPSSLQARLMGVLQQRMVEPLGADEARPVDVRVVAATDADLAEALGRREFREDLIGSSVATVRIPPLRDRREDIPLLYEHFACRAAKRFGREAPVPTPKTLRFLLGHPWPGNIRELARFAERLVLGLGDEAARPSQPAKRAGLAERVEAFERGLIVRELAANNGDTRAAAEALELPRKTLYDKLSRLGIDPRTIVAPRAPRTGPALRRHTNEARPEWLLGRNQRGLWRDGAGEAELGDLPCEVLDLLLGRAPVEVVGPEILVEGAVAQHVPDGGQHGCGDGAHRFLRAAALASAPRVAASSRSTTGRGVPAGAKRPTQTPISKPGTVSATAGRSGVAAKRRSPVTPSARSRPSRACGRAEGSVSNIRSTWPARCCGRARAAGPRAPPT